MLTLSLCQPECRNQFMWWRGSAPPRPGEPRQQLSHSFYRSVRDGHHIVE
jgi:hypothetical protein